MMKTHVLETSSAEWLEVLARCRHDSHHLPGWQQAAEQAGGGKAFGVHVTDGSHVLFIPLLRRDIGGSDWDASSAYGYPGPLVSDGAPGPFADAALSAAMDLLRENGCVSCFVRLNPIINAQWRSSVGTLVEHGMTVSIDLSKSEADHWRETVRGHRREISEAMRAGVTVRLDETLETLPHFIGLYNASMDRLHASEFLFFNDAYHYTLARSLGDRFRLFVAEEDGIIIGALTVTVSGAAGIMQGNLTGVDARYRHRQPGKIMLHAIRQWGRERGLRYFHLGGGLGGSAEDSLFRFKRGFSQDTHVFRTQRVVLDPGKYLELCGGVSSALGELGGYFPAYRKT
ncbi:GNAT family N-acetyltransferase [Cupriavidus sp. IDO]|uniref:GNAT family N-acetyltransferase n=1 Tax=Cupriavidus sp. IDO TaxID=1539142 RepID=UPI0005793E72|nr:GNAT family N-acetyltransferase [Cupriavidus sp. IDO]KWR89094.1 GCN5 family acetyltransferase [Cupriavidus sp. IDO]